ncbi:hypothetical protein MLD38_026874 [Melastoma candidum]|uniref:Uncharacterized protein n=1 Tax=Melastoma candidum TaxID=119954 RepID=A0ACB9P4U1_9MYRT|nr:hypothetical protein MLD38_026874 [Melastoma candidum]
MSATSDLNTPSPYDYGAHHVNVAPPRNYGGQVVPPYQMARQAGSFQTYGSSYATQMSDQHTPVAPYNSGWHVPPHTNIMPGHGVSNQCYEQQEHQRLHQQSSGFPHGVRQAAA